ADGVWCERPPGPRRRSMGWWPTNLVRARWGAIRAGGISKEAQSVYFACFPRDYTTIDSFKLIPKGGGDSLLLHQNTHVTIHADGTVTAIVDNARLECK